MSTDDSQKSKFKGVYRCGKRWKAQYQSQSVQFYLGTFDTEEEAASAYERKALSMSQSARPSRDEDSGQFTDSIALSDQFDEMPAPKRPRTGRYSDVLSTLQAKLMWDRLTAVYQRILLAKAVQERLAHSQLTAPSFDRETLLRSLNEEIVALNVVKQQLEEAVTRYFAREVVLKEVQEPVLDHSMFDLPFDAHELSLLPLSHLTTPLQSVLPPSAPNAAASSSVVRADTLYDVPPIPDSSVLGPSCSILSEISAITHMDSLLPLHSLLPHNSVSNSSDNNGRSKQSDHADKSSTHSSNAVNKS